MGNFNMLSDENAVSNTFINSMFFGSLTRIDLFGIWLFLIH